jgi:glycogen synthase
VRESRGVRPLGALAPEELARQFARAAIYALPARYEPFGFSALEAALAGCALVLGDIPSLREIWRDSAVFIAPDEAEKIAAALTKLIADASLRGDLSRRARKLAVSYSAERMAQGYMSLYEQLLSAQSQVIGNEFGKGPASES